VSSVPSLAWTLATAPPLDPSRDEARRWAWQELNDPVYAEHEPGWTARAILWLWHRLQDIALPAGPGGTGGVVILVALALLVVLVVWLRAGPLRRPGLRVTADAVLQGAVRTAAEHRVLADRAADEGRWEDAVRERFRAVVRGMEERGLIDELPGRTSQEVALDAASALPGLVGALHDAARLFDDISYGSRQARPDHETTLRQLDLRVTAARPLSHSQSRDGAPA
jgi:hypothetical protein